MSWQPELDELARRKAFAHEMGGADKVRRQHDGGRLTVRERIGGMLDAGSFQEVGTLSGIGEYDADNALTTVTPANCVFGRGTVDVWWWSATTSRCAADRQTPRSAPNR
jgi:acetyl-CoA carboxylase carboxyltransferase component